MAYEYILSERLDGVALITLNRPEKLNALSFLLMQEVDDALTGYEADDGVKAVILTGAGERAFSAGADIHEMAGLSSEELAVRSETRGNISWHIASYSKPLIGAINGPGLWRRGAALLLARSAHRLREDPIPLSRGELWAGQLELVAAGPGRHPQSQGAALHRARRRRRGSPAHRAPQPDRPRGQTARGGDRDGADDRQERRAHGAGHQAAPA